MTDDAVIDAIFDRLDAIDRKVTDIDQKAIQERFALSSWTPEAFHEPGTIGGIIVDEGAVREGKCDCIPLGDNSHLCYHKGVVGALSREQEVLFCDPSNRQILQVSPELQARQRILKDAAIICQAETTDIPADRRLEPFMNCLVKLGKKKGLDI